MSRRAEVDVLSQVFSRYLPLHRRTYERTIRRMSVKLPEGLLRLPTGTRACLLADEHLLVTVTSEVFLAFVECVERSSLDPVGAEGWVVTVTRRYTQKRGIPRAQDVARQVSLVREDGSFAHDLVPCNDNPEALVLAMEETARRRQQVETLLAPLKATDRELIIARLVDDVSYDDLVVTFGGTAPALRKRVERALDRMRTIAPNVVGLAA